MPRKSTKTTENIVTALDEALDTPLNLDWQETAEKLGLTIPELQERMSAKLDATVFSWLNIPHEHEPVIEAVARDLESESSVRRLEPQQEAQLPPVQPEPPILQEEEAPKQLAKQGKRKSTGLTKQRMNAIQKTVQDTVTLEEGIHTTELDAATTEGIQDGGQIATIYLVAKQVAENKIRKEAAKRRVAKTIQKTAKQKDFNPLAVLQKHGLNPTADDLAELNELATPAMASLGNASGEILSNSWANGLQIDCSDLNALMSDAWSE